MYFIDLLHLYVSKTKCHLFLKTIFNMTEHVGGNQDEYQWDTHKKVDETILI